MSTIGPDDELLAALGQVLDADDPLPDHLHAYASAVFELGGLDAELAALTFDSYTDAAPVALRAGEATTRVLQFAAADLSIELEVDSAAVHGLLAPAGRVAAVELQVSVGTASLPASSPLELSGAGELQFGVPAALARLRITTVSGDVVVTPWFSGR